MINILRRIRDFFFPQKESRRIYRLFFLLFYFKLIWFDFSWCLISTYRPFSYPETYLSAAILTLILMFPFVIFRMTKTTFALAVVLGILLVSNLIYFRTYYTAIPLSSYGLLDNMSGYTSSIFSSLRWTDAVFPLSTIVAAVIYMKSGRDAQALHNAGYATFLFLFVAVCLSGILILSKGGFKKAYELLQDSYTHTCGPVIYTVPGSVYYDYIRDREVYTPEIGGHVEHWTGRRTGEREKERIDGSAILKSKNQEITNDGVDLFRQTNCIIILLESFESWVINRSVEGQEITPCINSLLKDSTTLYAPYVLSQVKGGRSIDAQLMINTGLLPINTGVYSLKYPQSLYPSLEKAMKEKYGRANSFILTADKPMTWNQSVIAVSFGYDSLVSKKGFIQDEKVGPHYRHQLGDVSLLRQCADKIKWGETWKSGANIVQIVTYSGHYPFALPKELRKVRFSGDVPQMLNDYMTVANYTDRAVGHFIDAIRSMPQFENTLILLTGDHEGLVEMRDDLCSTPFGRDVVSPDPFVPLIIVNVPASLRSQWADNRITGLDSNAVVYDKVMGQIDIYPTLLDLLGLKDYPWRGLGVSILNPQKVNVAVDPYGKVYGDTTDVLPSEVQYLKEAWLVSDEIIRYDYFKRRSF
jgi:phosphoglycerol transferase MdoB-like AlkP superfamily enzyme